MSLTEVLALGGRSKKLWVKVTFYPFVRKVYALPYLVNAVDLVVAGVNGRATKRDKGVGAYVSNDDEVAAAVDAYLVS